MKNFIRWIQENRLWGMVITLLVIGVFSLTYYREKQWEASTGPDDYGFYSRIEFPLIDMRQRLLARPDEASDDIIILSLTEGAIKRYQDRYGRWPWPRRLIAGVVQYLRHADSVMMDIGFLDPSGVEIPPDFARELRDYLRAGRAMQDRRPDRATQYLDAVEQELAKYSQSDDVTLGHYSREYGPVHYAMWFVGLTGTPPVKRLRGFEQIMDKYGYGIQGERPPFPREDFMSPPVQPLLENSYAIAHISFTPDPDGPARRFDPFVGLRSYPEQGFDPDRPYLPILALSGYLQAQGIRPGDQEIRYENNQLAIGENLSIPIDRKGKVLIKYHGGLRTDDEHNIAYQEVPIERILSPILGDDFVDDPPTPEFFRGKKVFVGATAPGLFDLRATPFSAKEAGVAIHANILDMFHSREFLEPIKTHETILAVFGVTLTVGVIATFLSPVMALIIATLLLSLYTVMGLGLFNQGHLINLSAPVLSSTLTYGLILVYNLVFEQQKRRQIRNAFQHYLTASVMEEILQDPDKLELGGQRREISILFADIAGFTTFSEGRTATEVAEVINYILTEMTECIFRYDGVLDKYIGDEMVAEFGIIPVESDDYAERALNAAVDMRLRMQELREEWREAGEELLQLRIGVNTGDAATGNMGSEMLFDYTALGDTVNLGSRLEGANKQYNTLSMISESTYVQVEDKFEVREIDRIIVKGKDKPVTVYELLGRTGDVGEARLELRDRFEEALTLYRSQQWDEAIEAFEALTEEFPEDGPSPIFLERARDFKENPPDSDWDGVYRLTSK